MNIKQLLLISALCTFSAHAMEEIKVANENLVEKNDRTAQLEKLNKYVPNTVKFLLQTLRKKNVTDEVIKEIILFLRTDAFHMYVSQGLVDFWGKKWITHGIYIPYGRNIVSQYGCGYFSLSELLKNIHEHDSFNKLSSYSLLIEGWRIFSESAEFEVILKKSEEILDLDIDKCNIEKSNKIYKIALWIKNHKLQSLAAISAVAGILGYAAKKLRK